MSIVLSPQMTDIEKVIFAEIILLHLLIIFFF